MATSEYYERLRAAFRERRKALGLTQKQVADRLGCSREYVAQFEGGTCEPLVGNAEKFAQAVGSTLAELMGEHTPAGH